LALRMASLPSDQPDALLELIGDMVGLVEIAEFRTGLLRALQHAVPADWISLNDLSPDPSQTVVLIEPPFPSESHALYARHAYENPLLRRYLRTRDGRAYRFSDVASAAELRATALYREFYAPLGLEYQIAFTLPHRSGRVLAVALSRRECDFTDSERELLNRSRRFLIQSYRNSILHTQLLAQLELRAHGQRLPLEDPALAIRLEERGLSGREAEVLSWLATGRSNRGLAQALRVSERTVQKHLQSCFAKLGVHSRREAVELAWSWIAVVQAAPIQ
jgi:DNA-binding CsgD family transcriptional regulator